MSFKKKKKDPAYNFSDRTPAWVRSAIWYEIFPERFYPGKKFTPSLQQLYPASRNIEGWKISRWTGDWYQPEEWEKQHFENQFYRSVHARYYGGDLPGIEKKIPYLKELGINALYLTPIFYGISSHKYDAVCHHHIDPFFGPDPEKDLHSLQKANESDDPDTWIWTEADKYFLYLVKKLHNNDMRIIIDGVFNHTGRHFFAFRDILKKGKKSPYRNWYNITRWDKNLPDGFEYQGWAGTRLLPEFLQVNDTLAYGPEKYVKNIVKRWTAPPCDPEAGVDGWRLDVADCLPLSFWQKFRQWVRCCNPEAYITAEIVEPAPHCFQTSTFDALMNYPFGYISRAFFLEKKLSSAETLSRLEGLYDLYPWSVALSMQNIYSSHDTPRLATQIVNSDTPASSWDSLFFPSKLQNNPDYSVRAPVKKEKMVHRLMLLLQFSMMGAPFIYYGEEAGMWGANDPDCRKPMLWNEWNYDREIHHPFHLNRPPDTPSFDHELYNFYKRLIHIRKNTSALQDGTFQPAGKTSSKVLDFFRSNKEQTIRIVINACSNNHIFTVPDNRDYQPLLFLYPDVHIDGKRLYLPPQTGEYFLIR